MSIKTWKAEFYPVPAAEAKGAAEAVQHSLRKWKGLLPHNKDKHGVNSPFITTPLYTLVVDEEGERFFANAQTCALCHVYILDHSAWDQCPDCPLNKLQGGPCSKSGTPYQRYRITGNAKPIIELLEEIQDEHQNLEG